jgi:hypothetical protein
VQHPETKVLVSLGIGFADRDVAGNFKLAAHEHARYLKRMCDADAPSRQQHQDGRPELESGHIDYSLKGSIKIALPESARKSSTGGAGTSNPLFASMLPGWLPVQGVQVQNKAGAARGAESDDEFGDFVAS